MLGSPAHDGSATYSTVHCHLETTLSAKPWRSWVWHKDPLGSIYHGRGLGAGVWVLGTGPRARYLSKLGASRCPVVHRTSRTCSEDRYEQYDKMSAYELFRKCGVSQRCYQEFLRPTLLVGLFAPPEVRGPVAYVGMQTYVAVM